MKKYNTVSQDLKSLISATQTERKEKYSPETNKRET